MEKIVIGIPPQPQLVNFEYKEITLYEDLYLAPGSRIVDCHIIGNGYSIHYPSINTLTENNLIEKSGD